MIGTALGGLIGYLGHKDKMKKSTKSKKDDSLPDTPFLTKPKVRMYWEPDQIKGDKYIEKHRVWVLENSPVWTKKP
ncbi:MAG TPA: hypothetical protein DCL41_00480 [Bdellovibrionales bacterium]|nr:hypothetical protein [Pseudobdellovibrionaceae bacterium]HAG90312.1 hypothetical protein [Bdellovibrionales bacterium]